MENYKKKYEGLMKNIEHLHKSVNPEWKRIIECYIPELKESEDERIRKQLLNWFKDCKLDAIDNETLKRDDIIAWLEKQGVQKADKCEGCNNVKGCITCTDGDQYAHIKEYNPAWSEEDEKILQTLINDTEKTLFAIKQEERPDIMSGLSEIYIERLRWLKSLKDRVQPQPKQDWSEEDEDILNTIINHFKVDIECTDEDDMVRWLKSLKGRYTWKPSDYELEVLRLAAEKDGTCLMGLYEQLKKL